MKYPTEEKPQRLESDNLILEQLPDELMIFDPDRNKAFCLNQTAAFVWRHCDGKTTVSEMTELLREDWGKPVDEQVVWFALDLLAKDGLLAPSTALPAGRRCDTPGSAAEIGNGGSHGSAAGHRVVRQSGESARLEFAAEYPAKHCVPPHQNPREAFGPGSRSSSKNRVSANSGDRLPRFAMTIPELATESPPWSGMTPCPAGY